MEFWYSLAVRLSHFSRNITVILPHQKIPVDTDLLVIAGDKALQFSSASIPAIQMPHDLPTDSAIKMLVQDQGENIWGKIPVLGIGTGFTLAACTYCNLKNKFYPQKNIVIRYKSTLNANSWDNHYEALLTDNVQFPIKGESVDPKINIPMISTSTVGNLISSGYSKDLMIGGTIWNPAFSTTDELFDDIVFKLLNINNYGGGNSDFKSSGENGPDPQKAGGTPILIASA